LALVHLPLVTQLVGKMNVGTPRRRIHRDPVRLQPNHEDRSVRYLVPLGSYMAPIPLDPGVTAFGTGPLHRRTAPQHAAVGLVFLPVRTDFGSTDGGVVHVRMADDGSQRFPAGSTMVMDRKFVHRLRPSLRRLAAGGTRTVVGGSVPPLFSSVVFRALPDPHPVRGGTTTASVAACAAPGVATAFIQDMVCPAGRHPHLCLEQSLPFQSARGRDRLGDRVGAVLYRLSPPDLVRPPLRLDPDADIRSANRFFVWKREGLDPRSLPAPLDSFRPLGLVVDLACRLGRVARLGATL